MCEGGGDGVLLWESGSYQEPQHRAAPGQFAYGWHGHHAGHQQPDGLDEAFSAMRDFWQRQLVDQAPQQHRHLHADHASPPGPGQVTHADTKYVLGTLPLQTTHQHLLLVREDMQEQKCTFVIKQSMCATAVHIPICGAFLLFCANV